MSKQFTVQDYLSFQQRFIEEMQRCRRHEKKEEEKRKRAEKRREDYDKALVVDTGEET